MQTHAQSAYLAGVIVCELEARGYAGGDGFTPATMGNIARNVGKMTTYARHAMPKAASDETVCQLMGEFKPPSTPTPTPEQACFWIGYYHQKIARDLPESFADKLRQLISDAGHTSESAFAKASGISQQTINSLTTGQRRPTWDTVQQLAKALGVSTDVFRTT